MDDKADFSAEMVAASRALACRERDASVRNPDYLAEEFLGPFYRILARIPKAPELALRLWQYKIPGIYHYLNARTHHIDRVLSNEVISGVEQIVLLGAGYDTRPIRLRHLLRDRAVFEVDKKATRERKLELYRHRFGGCADFVTYVECDFARTRLFAALADAGFDEARSAFFVWEGVTYYLDPADVDDLLDEIRRLAAPGTSIVFDYLYSAVLRGSSRLYGADQAAAFLRRRRQPYRFGIEKGALKEFMRKRGFSVVSDLEPHEMEQSYLMRLDGTLRARAFGGYGMAHCRLLDQPGSQAAT